VEIFVWFWFWFPLYPGMVSIFSCVFLAIWTFFFEKVLFSSVAHFCFGLLVFGEFSFFSSLYILGCQSLV
jgi:hypothetical protein